MKSLFSHIQKTLELFSGMETSKLLALSILVFAITGLVLSLRI